jgi:hypothetical protein
VTRLQNLDRRGDATAVIRSTTMLDVFMLAIGLGFFALSVAYVYACERL